MFSKYRHLLMIIILIFIFSLRIIHIESDLSAPWGILNYQPIDEGIYANMALNKINYGALNPNLTIDSSYEYLIQPHVITNILGNTIIYVCLKIFGDNFLGFRMGSICIGLLSSILVYFTLCNIHKRIVYKQAMLNKSYFIIAMLTVFFSFNFVLYNASRLVEPTLYRMFFLIMVLFVFTSYKICESLKAFLMAFIAVASIFLVYVTNIFILFAFLLLLLSLLIQKKYDCIKNYLFFGIFGGGCAYLISLYYYLHYWNTTPIKNLFACIQSFSNQAGYTVESTNFLTNIAAFFTSNILLYNPIIIWGFMWGIYFVTKNRIHKTDSSVIGAFAMIFALLLQTLFSEDYIVRKELVILPPFVIVLYYVIVCYIEGYKVIPLKIRIVLNVLSSLVGIFVVLYRLFFIGNKTNFDFSINDRNILFFLISSYCIVLLFDGFKTNYTKFTILFLLIITFGVNTIFIVKYNWKNQTYCDKFTMLDLNERIGDGYVLGEYINGFTLYNNLKPLLHTQDTLFKYMINSQELYYFDYSDYDTYNLKENYLNNHVKKTIQYPREFQTFGLCREMALFQWK